MKDIEVDVEEIRLLCDYASDYLGVGELADFTPVTFEQLLLDIYPRKVIAPPESAEETVAAARTLVEFLLDSGEIGTKMAGRMRERLTEIAPEMPAALADTSKFGMAKSLFAAMGADDDSGDTPLPFPTGFAAAGRQARQAEAAECDCWECSPLPAVRLPTGADVAAAVRADGLLRHAHEVVAWMRHGGRTPTARGALRVRDARRATGELGVPAPALAWELALSIGLASTGPHEETAGPPALADRDDAEVLDLWAGAVAFLTGGPLAPVTGSPRVDAELPVLHDLLYRSQEPLTLEAFGEHMSGAWGADERDPPDAPQEPPEDLGAALDALALLGTVERDGDELRLTPQGLWGLREVYSRMGLTAPVAPDPADGDASVLIDALLGGVRPAQAETDVTGWLERRTPPEAAHDLLEAARGGGAPHRGAAARVLDRLGPEAASSVRSFLEDLQLRPHAVRWLERHGLDAPDLTPQEILWLDVDVLAAVVPAAEADPAAFESTVAAARPSARVIEEMWQVDHPDVAEVLDLLGRHLPDKDAAKAARKAAFKARSRGIH
nr:hypothetical protein [Sphaerisporangium rubeum]